MMFSCYKNDMYFNCNVIITCFATTEVAQALVWVVGVGDPVKELTEGEEEIKDGWMSHTYMWKLKK